MSSSEEEARLREHLAELRKAARGIGKDVEIDLARVGSRIEELPRLTAKDAKYAVWEIEDELAAIGHRVDVDLKKLPGEIGRGAAAVGRGIGEGAVRIGSATRDGLEDAGHAAKEGTKNVFARAAGVKRTPMKGWSPPPADDESKGSE